MEPLVFGINVTLSDDQKQEIRNASINHEKIRLRLTKDSLRGHDLLLIPAHHSEEMKSYGDLINAVVDKQTVEEMLDERLEKIWDEIRDEIRDERLEEIRDETLEEVLEEMLVETMDERQKKILEEMRKKTGKELREEILEESKSERYEQLWKHYGLFFVPKIEESMENKGIEFDLDYSTITTDLTRLDAAINNINKFISFNKINGNQTV